MKRNVTKLMAALVLLLFIAPLGMWGQAPVGTTLWAETWTGGSTNPAATPSTYSFTGTTVYGNATLTYTQDDSGTKLYSENNAGGTAPELLLKSGGKKWTISNIPSGSATGLTLTFKANYDRTVVSSATTGVTIGTKSFSNKTVTYPITVASNVTSFSLTFTNTESSNVRIDNIELVVTTAGGPSYTITAQSNNTDYGTVALNGSVITGTPKPGCRYASPAYTVSPANSATVAQNGNNFTVTPSANTTVTINFEAIPSHTATFSVNNDNELTTSSQVIEGAAITFPADPADIGDMTFMGWTNAAIDGIIDTPPTYVTSATMGSNDVTFYAVFAEVSGSSSASLTKMTSGDTFAASDKVVIVAEGNAMYQQTINSTYVNKYSFDNNVSTIASDDKKWFTVSAGSTNGTWKLGDATNGYVYNSSSNDLAISTSNSTNFTLAWNNTENKFTLKAGSRWLSYRSDLANAYFRMGGTGTTPNGSGYFDIYKYNESIVSYSNYCTTVGAIITVNPDAIELAADELEGTTGITFANLEITESWNDCHVTFYDATGTTEVAQPDWVIEALVAEDEDNNAYLVSCAVYANEGPARTAYFKVYANDENDIAVYSNLVTLSQAGYVMPSSVETWELTTLSELTADDVFVIVCYDGDLETSYAMANNNGTSAAPSAVVVTVDNDALTTTPAANLKWNVVSTEDGYIFYPNGSSDTWLYCNNSNNGVRVGTGNAKHFTIDGGSGYLTTTETNDQRYLGVYTDAPDWRCYDGTSGNISNQTFAFYKKVAASTDTNTKTIQPYNSTYDHYYLIASPVMAVEPSVANGFLTNNYDLYRFDQSHEDEEWLNYEVTPFYLLSGKGYLYANSGNNGNATTITFTGVPYNGNGEVTLSKVPGVKFSGWNLIGNPRNATAILKDANNQDQAYYTINQTNNEVAAGTLGADISAMEGVFVVAEEDGDVVTFAEAGGVIGTLPEIPDEPGKKGALNLNISKPQGLVIDRAIVRFDNGGQLPKFQLNPNNTKIYFTEDNKDFAVVRSANEGEMPVNFRAAENGTYSLSVEVGDTEMAYLHLIDNKTGVDVDLLANPSYTFEANANDYESRFRLVFNATGVEENNTNETFAFFNGSEWVVNTTGNATLQVVDMMGRVLSSEQINGNTAVNLNQAAGIYVLRLVNGENVMVQKVVVR
ncbi:MAG: T9SS type A sorting domain-containing protein [Bacteroidales bacterium]|nr:T9SS type A sorting domain-containing protein [Bacteroidales bacterium]